MQVVTRSTAKQTGALRYFTGEPCEHGHVAERLTSNGACCECSRARKLQHYHDNREDRIAKNRTWKTENAGRVKHSRQQYNAQNAEKAAEQLRQWKQTNRSRVTAYERTREAMKVKATPAWADAEQIDMWYSVASVLSRSGVRFEVDHVVPLRSKFVQGLHSHDNMQVLPARANRSKGNRMWPDMPEAVTHG